MPQKTTNADIIIVDRRWRAAYPALLADAQQTVQLVLKHQKKPRANLTVLFSDDAQLQQLNHDYRGKNKPTNVLSFPSGEQDFLGDIALAYETVRSEKIAQRKSWRAHSMHLLIHGTLHLLGYDHEIEADAKIMEALEIQLLAQLGLVNPYE
jgi:probable rRNA maturation factor